jgi:hypothetical protein
MLLYKGCVKFKGASHLVKRIIIRVTKTIYVVTNTDMYNGIP